MVCDAEKQFREIYDSTFSDISRYVVCKCSNIADVSDILQNIYLDVYRALLNGKDVSKAYVVGMAKNKVRDYYRFSFKHFCYSLSRNEEIAEDIPDDVDISESFLIRYDAEQVWDYLTKKPVVISKIFYLYYYLGYSISEIHELPGLTESNVKHYLYRTLKELRSFMKEEDSR